MRFASLGSGSKGNATIVQHGNTNLMIDCGFSVKELQRRLARLDLELGDLSAVLLTHEHSDHVSGIGPLTRKYAVPVYATTGTWHQLDMDPAQKESGHHCINSHENFAIGDVEVQPYPVPHDAKEPCQFVFNDGAVRLGTLTDTGHITPHINAMLSGCDALLLECNHDSDMLQNSAYPWTLKQRVGGHLGHLSNDQAAQYLENTDCSGFKHFVAAHLSEKNNHPNLVRESMAAALGCTGEEIDIIDQESGLDWRDLK